MKEHVLITGGAGFIGSHLAAYHLDKGDKVWVVDDLSTGVIDNIAEFLGNPDFKFDKRDICAWTKLVDAVAWADSIYHMAAMVGQYNVIAHPIDTAVKNVEGCAKVLSAMGREGVNARLLLASTSSVYYHVMPGEDGTLHEDAVLRFMPGILLHETYPLSKVMDEVMALSYIHEKKIKCTIARLFNTIGTHQLSRYGMVVPNFVKQALCGEPIKVFGTGEQTRCFTNVHDTIRALDLLLSNPESSGGIYNVGSDYEISILELAKMVKARTNSTSEIQCISYQEAYGFNFCDVDKRHPNLEKLRSLTGFKHEWTIEQTIDEIAADERLKLKNTKVSSH